MLVKWSTTFGHGVFPKSTNWPFATFFLLCHTRTQKLLRFRTLATLTSLIGHKFILLLAMIIHVLGRGLWSKIV